jgi:hypothetical protein
VPIERVILKGGRPWKMPGHLARLLSEQHNEKRKLPHLARHSVKSVVEITEVDHLRWITITCVVSQGKYVVDASGVGFVDAVTKCWVMSETIPSCYKCLFCT